MLVQRLRRAQHPGDRRQAHPADPQRDEHRRRARGLRPRDRLARRAVRHRRRARLSRRAGAASRTTVARRARRRSASRASATCSRAIKVAKHFDLGADDVIVTVATDGAAMYDSERELARREALPGRLRRRRRRRDLRRAPARRRRPTTCASSTYEERERIFNLGYFTWVEQQGVSLDEFEARRHQALLGREIARAVGGLGRADRRVQRAHRRAGEAVTPSQPPRLRRLRRRAAPPASRIRSAARTRARATSTTSSAAQLDPAGVAFPAATTSRTRSSATARSSTPTTSARAGGLADDELLRARANGSTSASRPSTGTASR